MTGDDWVISRFESVEGRVTIVEKDIGEIENGQARDHQQTSDMIAAFNAMRTAMYSLAVVVVGAAMILVLLGGK